MYRSIVEAFDWNGGGYYEHNIDGTTYLGIPNADYSATTIYDFHAGDPIALFEVGAWTIEMSRVR